MLDTIANVVFNAAGNPRYYLSANEKVGTGSVVCIYDDLNNFIEDAEVVVKGDLDGDAEISLNDFKLIKKYISKDYNLSNVQLKASDINNDGKINSNDLIKFKKSINK